MNSFKTLVDGKEVDLVVKLPGRDDLREADKVHNQTFKDALESGAILRIKLDNVLRSQGIWDDEREAKVKALQKELSDYEKILFVKGGIKLKDARDIAIAMTEKRNELKEVLSERNALEAMTAEAQADNARFNFIVSRCVVYNDTKKPFFKDYADYLNNAGGDVAQKAAQILVSLMFGLGNYEEELPENKFLKKYKFVDDKFRLVNKDGKLVDKEGRLIDENGRYIDVDGNFVDKDGVRVDAQGNYVGEPAPFLDDDGNPILEEAVKTLAEADFTKENVEVAVEALEASPAN